MPFAAVALLLTLLRPTDLTFVRHGETVANATGKYNSKTINTFSKKGEEGVAALTKRLLAEPKFDLILVSPSPRALRTIAPYLQATRQRAMVWPLLYECCTGKRTPSDPNSQLRFSGNITLPKDIAGMFYFEKGRQTFPVAPDYSTGLLQVRASLDEFRQRFVGQRVLLVGHSGHGGQFLHGLTGKWQKVENTTEIHLRLP